MAQNRKAGAFPAQGVKPADLKSRNKFDSASRDHLHAVGHQGGIVANGGQRSHADHGGGRPGIQGEPENNAARRPKQFAADNDQTGLGIETGVPRTIAVSSGIRPV